MIKNVKRVGLICTIFRSNFTFISAAFHLSIAGVGNLSVDFSFLLALQPLLGVVFYSPLAGFSPLSYEVS